MTFERKIQHMIDTLTVALEWYSHNPTMSLA